GAAGAASVARGADCGAGGAMRLLLQRPDHQGGGVVVQDAATNGDANPVGDERAYLPVWDVPADSVGDPACCESDGGRQAECGGEHEGRGDPCVTPITVTRTRSARPRITRQCWPAVSF